MYNDLRFVTGGDGWHVVQDTLSGSVMGDLARFTLGFLDAARTRACVIDANNAGYVIPLPFDGTTQPMEVTQGLPVQAFMNASPGMNSSLAVYQSASGEFTADGKLLLAFEDYDAANAANGYSTVLVDPITTPPTQTNLHVGPPVTLRPDGTVIGVVYQNNSPEVVSTSLANPAKQTPLAEGWQYFASADGGRLLVFENDNSSVVYDVDTATTTPISPSNDSSSNYGQWGVISADGARVLVVEYSPLPCVGTSATATFADLVTHRTTTTALDCGATQVHPSSDGSAVVYVESGVLYGTTGAQPIALSATTERFVTFWVERDSNRVVVETLDADNAWHLTSIHADGTGRTDLGESLPLDRVVTQVQLDAGFAYVTADALTQGTVELFRFAIP